MPRDKAPPGVALDRMKGQAPAEPPPPFDGVLPSGLAVKWRMPDPFEIIAFNGMVPDPITAAVIDLLEAEKTYTPEDPKLKHRYLAANIKGMYGLAAAMLIEPRLDASVEYGDGDTFGRREIGHQDVIQLYFFFRAGTGKAPRQIADTNGAERASGAGSVLPEVRDDASAGNAD